jgi:hypothetical protein
MKKIFPLFVALWIGCTSYGQFMLRDIGDTLGPYTVINFEEPTPYITILPVPGNLWQIGAPHNKPFFGAAYSLPNAIITDTTNPYPASNSSSFELIVGAFNTLGYGYQIFIDFRHKFDTDTLKDGGNMTVSWDNGQTWVNIIDDSTHYEINPHIAGWSPFGNTNLYDHSSFLYNGDYGFSGNSGGWIHSCMAWYYIPVKSMNQFPGDTMRIRFNFISDDIQHNREGWMVDEIRLFGMDLGSGIKDYMKGSAHSYIIPNPVKTAATITLDRPYSDVKFELYDSRGALMMAGNPGKCHEFRFDRGSLPPGFYYLKLLLDGRITDSHKVILN